MKEIKDDLVSIIIPVYNAELYLRECLDSVRYQSFKNIEILCVDDGSTDSSKDILYEYAQNDERFNVLEQNNSYAGVARNNGLAYACGKYVVFWDADDIFDLNTIEKMYEAAEKEKADIVVCAHQTKRSDDNSIVTWKNNLYDAIEPGETICFNPIEIKDCLFQKVVGWAWVKMFNRAFIQRNNITFQNLRTSNDGLFVNHSLVAADRLVAISDALIIHRVANGLSLENTRSKSWNCGFEMLYATHDLLVQKNIYGEYQRSFLNYALYFIMWNVDSLCMGDAYKAFYDVAKSECEKRFKFLTFPREFYYDFDIYEKYLLLHQNSPDEYFILCKNKVQSKDEGIHENIKKEMKNRNVVIFGCGNRGNELHDILARYGITVRVFCDNSSKKQGKYMNGVIVSSLKEVMSSVENPYFAVASAVYAREIKQQLTEAGVKAEDIFIYNHGDYLGD